MVISTGRLPTRSVAQPQSSADRAPPTVTTVSIVTTAPGHRDHDEGGRVTAAEAQVTNAQEALRLVEGRYRAGIGVFLDVLDAQTDLDLANTNRVNAQPALTRFRRGYAAAFRSLGAR